MTRRRKGELSSRQLRFIEEYLVDNNAKQAAIRAGYSPRSARERGCRLLQHPEIKERIRLGIEVRSRRLRLEADRVLSEYARIAFADLRRYFIRDKNNKLKLRAFDELSDDEAAAVATFSLGERARFKLHDKQRALDVIAQYLGLIGKRSDRTPPPQEELGEDPREVLRRMLDKVEAMPEPEA